ncbi:MAG: methyltransferase type 11 [Chloroflexota bacterium]
MGVNVRLDLDQLRLAIQEEYAEVAVCPTKGFHFHTGRIVAERLDYDRAAVGSLPDRVVESFAGVGNPFALGRLNRGEVVVEVGSGAGLDAILAGQQVGPAGRVIGVDMTPAMVKKARANAALLGLQQVEFHQGLAEALPLPDCCADVVISNGVINLCPDKEAVYREIYRVLKSGGRIQIADIIVQEAVPDDAREDISLWTG